jgi:hypothetical protein
MVCCNFILFIKLFTARLLADLADEDDICTDLSDMLPDTVTAFTKLFTDENAMLVCCVVLITYLFY